MAPFIAAPISIQKVVYRMPYKTERKLSLSKNKSLSRNVGPRMQSCCQIAVSILAALVTATPNYPPASTVGSEHQYTTTILSTVTITGTPEASNTITNVNYMTITVTNLLGNDMSLSFGSDAGGPSRVGNPSSTSLHDNGFTQYAFPTGWAGRICVGPDFNPNGSKIEGSYTGPPDIDISYIDGYSVPITCSSEGTPVSGCNIDLFKQPNIPCNNQVEIPGCLNPAQTIANSTALHVLLDHRHALALSIVRHRIDRSREKPTIKRKISSKPDLSLGVIVAIAYGELIAPLASYGIQRRSFLIVPAIHLGIKANFYPGKKPLAKNADLGHKTCG